MSAQRLKRFLNVYPPYLGAGIRVLELSDDYLHARVRMRLGRLNRNAVGTQFGGSLYSMTDPFYMLMLIHHLGREHRVWDKAAEIEFVAPGRGDVFADFRLTPELIDELREEAADDSRVLRWLPVDVVDSNGETVAKVRKQLYVRRKPR